MKYIDIGSAMRTTNRIQHIDVAKGIGIILVIVGHALEVFFNKGINGIGETDGGYTLFMAWKFIYSFHMPLFFFISGLSAFSISEHSLEKAVSRFLYLLFVASATQIMFGPLLLLLNTTSDAASLPTVTMIKNVVLPAVVFNNQAIIVTWFLPSLALIYLLAWSAKNLTHPASYVFVICFVVISILSRYSGVNLFQSASILPGFIIFIAGYIASNARIVTFQRSFIVVAALASLAIVIATFKGNRGCLLDITNTCNSVFYNEFGVLMIAGRIGFAPIFMFTAICGIIFVIASSLLMRGLLSKFLASTGRQSMHLLIINGVFLVFVEPAIIRIVGSLPPPAIVIPLLVVAQFLVLAILGGWISSLLSFAQSSATKVAFSLVRAMSVTCP